MVSKNGVSTPKSGDDLIFARDFLDNNRMNLMHSLWVKLFGYVIHPSIPKDSPDLRVADVGSGTGIWLLDVRDLTAPSARLEGLDISFDAAPPLETLPSNVKFRHWDVNEDVPRDLVGVFDIVHVRFLSCVLFSDQVPAAVERLFKMLKPGGYIQWGEPDFESIQIDKTRPENETKGLSELLQVFAVQDLRTKPTWLTSLPAAFSAAGFVQVEVDRKDAPPHLAFMLHECGMMLYVIYCRRTKNGMMRNEINRIMPTAVEESRRGAYTTAVRWTVVAKKPAGA